MHVEELAVSKVKLKNATRKMLRLTKHKLSLEFHLNQIKNSFQLIQYEGDILFDLLFFGKRATVCNWYVVTMYSTACYQVLSWWMKKIYLCYRLQI